MRFYFIHKQLLCISTLLFLCLTTNAQHGVNVKVEYPKEVAVGDQFYIHYQVTDSEVPEFEPPTFDGFLYLNSSRSSSSQISIINGKTTSSHSLTVSISLEAVQEGNITISGGSIQHHGVVVASIKPINIRVVKGNHSNLPSQSSPKDNNTLNQEEADDVFIVVTTSKEDVYVQEPLLVTFTIYYRVSLNDISGELPTLSNFYSVDLETPQTLNRVNHKGHTYNVAVWKKSLLYPLKAGEYKIPSFECEVSYFGYPKNKKIKTQEKLIKVKSLPPFPNTYTGAVGIFSIDQPQINKKHLSSGDVLSVKLNISGTGNFTLFSKPEFVFPEEFESYRPRSSEDLSITEEGHKGTRTYEYLAVPRKQGTYYIPPIKFTYFDINSKSFVTLSTDSIEITADESVELSVPTTSQSQQPNGISPIKTGAVDLRNDHYTTLYSWKWLLAYLIPIIFLTYVYVRKHYLTLSYGNAKNKQKNAFKIAMKELQTLESSIETPSFQKLDKTLHTLYAYVNNKFVLEQKSLNKETISQSLLENGIAESTIKEFINILETCEMAKYTQTMTTGSLQSILDKSKTLLSTIEQK